METFTGLQREIRSLSDPRRAQANKWFFKTGKGEYGEGDKFAGLTVPKARMLAKKYRNLPLEGVHKLLQSPVHENRIIALFILVSRFERGTEREKRAIASFYLANLDRVNNWDLVDSSAPYILGQWLAPRDKKPLYTLARSKNLWRRRVAMVSTLAFIRNGDCDDALRIAELLLKDKEDLMHKASGWMLREVGKRCSREALTRFLDWHSQDMPRTMLRYAIEHLSPSERRDYLTRRA